MTKDGIDWKRSANLIMSIIGTVSTVLSHKQHTEDIFVISPDATVFEAIRIMAEKNLILVKGAVPGHNGSYVKIERWK